MVLRRAPPASRREIWHVIISTGQSLATGVVGSLSAPTPPIADSYKLIDTSGRYDLSDPTASTLELVPLTEPLRNRTYATGFYPDNIDGLTPAYGIASTLTRLGWEKHGGLDGGGEGAEKQTDNNGAAQGGGEQLVKHVVIPIVTGRGGATMAMISKDGTGPEYASSIFEARAIAHFAKAAGATLVFDAVVLTHGEADALVCNAGYAEDVLRLQRDYAADVMRLTSQTKEPVLVLSQQATCPLVRDFNTAVIDAMWRVQNMSDGKVVCSGPKYQYAYPDGLHLTAGGYARMGEEYGLVLHKLLAGETFVPLRPNDARMTGAVKIRVRFNVPAPPLRWDEYLKHPHQEGPHVAFRRGRGFEVRDAKGVELEIYNVRLRDDGESAVITLTQPPFHHPLSVAYAMVQAGEGFGPGFCGGSSDGRLGHLCDGADEGAVEQMRVRVEDGGHVLVAHGDRGWEMRSVYDLVKEEGGDNGIEDDDENRSYRIVGIDPADRKRAFLDRPWAGEEQECEVSARHNQANYCVSFVMDVETGESE